MKTKEIIDNVMLKRAIEKLKQAKYEFQGKAFKEHQKRIDNLIVSLEKEIQNQDQFIFIIEDENHIPIYTTMDGEINLDWKRKVTPDMEDRTSPQTIKIRNIPTHSALIQMWKTELSGKVFGSLKKTPMKIISSNFFKELLSSNAGIGKNLPSFIDADARSVSIYENTNGFTDIEFEITRAIITEV